MKSFGSSAPRPLAHIPSIPIFDPLEFDRSLPSSQYTLIKTDDLRIMYKEIGRVQTYLHNLIHHGDVAQPLVIDDSKQAKPAAAAVERIPPEILSMIFQQFVPPQNDSDLDRIQIPELTEILIPGQICRSWREAAIATPSLWSSLRFNLKPENSVDRMVAIATTCLARAKTHPLSISLTWDAELTQYCPIIAALFAHSHQWCNISLFGRNSYLAVEELRAFGARLTRLRRLEIDYSTTGNWDSLDTFLISPKLRIVDLFNYGQPWHYDDQFPLLPWRQLQQIVFDGHVGDALELLRISPSVQVFKGSIWGSSGLQHVHHASLSELNVEGLDCGSASHLIGGVALPALVSLSYKSDQEAFPGDIITAFVQRSQISQSLQTLSLTLDMSVRNALASSDIAKCLKCMPNLSQLSLHDPSKRYTDTGGFHSGDIASICAFLTPRSILPKLKRFAITGPPQMSCVLVAQMIRWRWRDVDEAAGAFVRLESVEFNYPGPCAHAKSSMIQIPARIQSRADGRALALLHQYQSEGLRVVGSPIDEGECIECIEQQGFDAFAV